MRIIATFLLIMALFAGLVASKTYQAHTERQQQQEEKKSLRQKIKERECRLMFPTQDKYYRQCVGGKGEDA